MNNTTLIKEAGESRGNVGSTLLQELVGEGDENTFDAQVIENHSAKRKCVARNLSEYPTS